MQCSMAISTFRAAVPNRTSLSYVVLVLWMLEQSSKVFLISVTVKIPGFESVASFVQSTHYTSCSFFSLSLLVDKQLGWLFVCLNISLILFHYLYLDRLDQGLAKGQPWSARGILASSWWHVLVSCNQC